MSPLTNAVLGVLFLGIGAIATFLMYSVRGRVGEETVELPRRNAGARDDHHEEPKGK